jgi:hypothetical protein
MREVVTLQRNLSYSVLVVYGRDTAQGKAGCTHFELLEVSLIENNLALRVVFLKAVYATFVYACVVAL